MNDFQKQLHEKRRDVLAGIIPAAVCERVYNAVVEWMDEAENAINVLSETRDTLQEENRSRLSAHRGAMIKIGFTQATLKDLLTYLEE